jgi:hypothetical protein
MSDGTFSQWAPRLRGNGFWPRPIKPGTKACHLKGWQLPDPEIEPLTLASWTTQHATDGIGLLLGSPFADGTVLAALDIDDDRYSRVASVLLNDPPSGRIGNRGILYFVRLLGELSIRKFVVNSEESAVRLSVGEFLGSKHLTVIPPTIHPDTSQPYRWIGRPLYEVHFTDLPLVEV